MAQKHQRDLFDHAAIWAAVAAALAAAAAAGVGAWQANIANRALAVAKDTEQRQLRAYLHVSHDPMTVSDNTAIVEVYIFHSGQTPAYKIKLTADIEVGHFPLPDAEKLTLPTGLATYEFGALYGTDPIKQRISMPQNSN